MACHMHASPIVDCVFDFSNHSPILVLGIPSVLNLPNNSSSAIGHVYEAIL